MILSSVTVSTDDFLNYLNQRDLSLGTNLEIISVEKFDGSFTVNFDNKKESLSKMVSEKLLVTKK